MENHTLSSFIKQQLDAMKDMEIDMAHFSVSLNAFGEVTDQPINTVKFTLHLKN